MKDVQWTKGVPGFTPLGDGSTAGNPETGDGSGPGTRDSNGGSGTGGPSGPTPAGGILAAGTVGGGSMLLQILSFFGVVAAVDGAVALLVWILSFKDQKNQTTSSKKSSKSSRTAIEIHKRHMYQVTSGRGSTPKTIASSHSKNNIQLA